MHVCTSTNSNISYYIASVDDVIHDQSPSDPPMLPEKLNTNKGYIRNSIVRTYVSEQKLALVINYMQYLAPKRISCLQNTEMKHVVTLHTSVIIHRSTKEVCNAT